MSDTAFVSEPVNISCSDGQQLAATLYLPQQSNGLSLQINAATGVPRGYYNAFAGYQAARGFTVLTFDYRGIGGSQQSAGAPKGIPAPRMLDWGMQDVPAAAAFLAQRFPALTPTLLGHSFGGQVLGLMPQADAFAAIVTVASQHGYWRNWPRSHQAKLFFAWYMLVPVLLAVRAKAPSRLFGGEPLPRGVLADWSRWCRSPHYVCDERGAPLRPYNERVRAPIRMISFSDDDDFGPRKGVDRLAEYYPQAQIERLHVMPADWGLQRIGHFGFFKREMPAERWAEIGDWLSRTAAARQQAA
ncbi:MAG: alpha/beta fold hydrolase [Ferrovibrio sp.]|uniref:alpha/beta hydrolase family protein n=1 Tax=Ferrovibrio sp. TaxID=1917215 RepID=UPI002623B390|nr:alpha/beta fold hydrolase [Ferrovibrio sp.]MCW0234147.1 alpha/beta fold hydrolase [Ferrovibrio sp.]